MNWPRELPRPNIVGIRKRLNNMRCFWFYSAVENGEHTQLVHPLIRDIQRMAASGERRHGVAQNQIHQTERSHRRV